jgi:hypothetical protein
MKQFNPNPIQKDKLRYHSGYISVYSKAIVARQNQIHKDNYSNDFLLQMYRSRIKNHHNESCKLLSKCYN